MSRTVGRIAVDPASTHAIEVANRLHVDLVQGLAVAEAARRLEMYGANRLTAAKTESALQAFLRQYRDFMQLVLLVAAVVNLVVTGDVGTSLVLAGLTLFNAIIGLRQEAKAEESVAALVQMMKTVARVRRDGQAVEIDAGELVPGDVVLIEAGNRVSADGRMTLAATLEIEEAAPARRRDCAALHGHPRDRAPQRDRQAAARGGDARRDVRDLLGQDRNADPEQDDRPGDGDSRLQPVHRHGRGLRHRRRDQARRRLPHRPRPVLATARTAPSSRRPCCSPRSRSST